MTYNFLFDAQYLQDLDADGEVAEMTKKKKQRESEVGWLSEYHLGVYLVLLCCIRNTVSHFLCVVSLFSPRRCSWAGIPILVVQVLTGGSPHRIRKKTNQLPWRMPAFPTITLTTYLQLLCVAPLFPICGECYLCAVDRLRFGSSPCIKNVVMRLIQHLNWCLQTHVWYPVSVSETDTQTITITRQSNKKL